MTLCMGKPQLAAAQTSAWGKRSGCPAQCRGISVRLARKVLKQACKEGHVKCTRMHINSPAVVLCRRSSVELAREVLTRADRARDQSKIINLAFAHHRDISVKLAREVLKQAHKEGHLGNLEAERVLKKGDEALEAWIAEHQYVPGYQPLIHLPTGVLE